MSIKITTEKPLELFKRTKRLYDNAVKSAGEQLPEGTTLDLPVNQIKNMSVDGVEERVFFIRVGDKERFIRAVDINLG